jgi:deoxycytidine triphosphate deaminase
VRYPLTGNLVLNGVYCFRDLIAQMAERQKPLFSDSRGATGVLTDAEIQNGIDLGWLISRDTFSASSLEASSYDIRVGGKGIVGGLGTDIDVREEALELGPGAYGAVVSLEKLLLPEEVCARIGSKRGLAYEGIILLTGTIVDPGYQGHLLFGLYNASHRKVLLRYGRKLANIVFERLAKPPEKVANSDPNLLKGNLPDAFLDRMANMEVLPWMQISERVKQIEQITKDVLDLRARYEDVLQPIRELTKNVSALSQDVASLTTQTKSIAHDVTSLQSLITENSKQIQSLTLNVTQITGSVNLVGDRTRSLEAVQHTQGQNISGIQASLGRYQVFWFVFWGVLLLILGAAANWAVSKL